MMRHSIIVLSAILIVASLHMGGDKVAVGMPMPKYEKLMAVMYGPTVLASNRDGVSIADDPGIWWREMYRRGPIHIWRSTGRGIKEIRWD